MLHGRADEGLQVARALLPRPCAPEQPESVRPSATRRAPAHRSAAGLAGRRRDGVPVAQFATDYQGCAGPLRSMIASGALGGVQVGDLVVPDGFRQGFNPGAHLGSVDEIAFIEQATGLDRAGVEALCDSLARAAH